MLRELLLTNPRIVEIRLDDTRLSPRQEEELCGLARANFQQREAVIGKQHRLERQLLEHERRHRHTRERAACLEDERAQRRVIVDEQARTRVQIANAQALAVKVLQRRAERAALRKLQRQERERAAADEQAARVQVAAAFDAAHIDLFHQVAESARAAIQRESASARTVLRLQQTVHWQSCRAAQRARLEHERRQRWLFEQEVVYMRKDVETERAAQLRMVQLLMIRSAAATRKRERERLELEEEEEAVRRKVASDEQVGFAFVYDRLQLDLHNQQIMFMQQRRRVGDEESRLRHGILAEEAALRPKFEEIVQGFKDFIDLALAVENLGELRGALLRAAPEVTVTPPPLQMDGDRARPPRYFAGQDPLRPPGPAIRVRMPAGWRKRLLAVEQQEAASRRLQLQRLQQQREAAERIRRDTSCTEQQREHLLSMLDTAIGDAAASNDDGCCWAPAEEIERRKCSIWGGRLSWRLRDAPDGGEQYAAFDELVHPAAGPGPDAGSAMVGVPCVPAEGSAGEQEAEAADAEPNRRHVLWLPSDGTLSVDKVEELAGQLICSSRLAQSDFKYPFLRVLELRVQLRFAASDAAPRGATATDLHLSDTAQPPNPCRLVAVDGVSSCTYVVCAPYLRRLGSGELMWREGAAAPPLVPGGVAVSSPPLVVCGEGGELVVSGGGGSLSSYAGGRVEVEFTQGYSPGDMVRIKAAAPLALSPDGGTVLCGGRELGRFTGGAVLPACGSSCHGKSAPRAVLQLTENREQATPEAVRRLVHSLRFHNSSRSPSDGPRELSISLIDAHGWQATVHVTVIVESVDDPTELRLVRNQLTFHASHSQDMESWAEWLTPQPLHVFRDCVVEDPDTEFFVGGSLRVTCQHMQRYDSLQFADWVWQGAEPGAEEAGIRLEPLGEGGDSCELRYEGRPIGTVEMVPAAGERKVPGLKGQAFFAAAVEGFKRPKAGGAAQAGPGGALADGSGPMQQQEQEDGGGLQDDDRDFGSFVSPRAADSASPSSQRGGGGELTSPDPSPRRHSNTGFLASSVTDGSFAGFGGPVQRRLSAVGGLERQPSARRPSALAPVGGHQRRPSAAAPGGFFSAAEGGEGGGAQLRVKKAEPRLSAAMVAIMSRGGDPDPAMAAAGNVRSYREINVEFNESGNACIAAIQALLRSICFLNSSLTPSTATTRQVELAVTIGPTLGAPPDPSGAEPELQELSESVSIRVTPPLISVGQKFATLRYQEGSGAVRLSSFEVTHEQFADSYDGGFLSVEIVDGYELGKDVITLREGDGLRLETKDWIDAATCSSESWSSEQPTGRAPTSAPADLKASPQQSERSPELCALQLPDAAGGGPSKLPPSGAPPTDSGIGGRLDTETDIGFRSVSNETFSPASKTPSSRAKQPNRMQLLKSAAIGVGHLELCKKKLLGGLQDTPVSEQGVHRPAAGTDRTSHVPGMVSVSEVCIDSRPVGHLFIDAARGSAVLRFGRGSSHCKRRDICIFLRNLVYRNGEKSEQLRKLVRITLNDDAWTSSQCLVSVEIQPVDDVTEILLRDDRLRYRQCSDDGVLPLCVAPLHRAKVYDIDTEFFDGGYLAVELAAGAGKGDALSLLTAEQQHEQIRRQKYLLMTQHVESGRMQYAVITEPEAFVFEHADRKQIRLANGQLCTVTYPRSAGAQGASDLRIHFPKPQEEGAGLISRALVTYLLNCVAFAVTEPRYKDGVRSVQIRVSDGTNPQDGRAKMSIEVRQPLLPLPQSGLPVEVAPGSLTSALQKLTVGPFFSDVVHLTSGFLLVELGGGLCPDAGGRNGDALVLALKAGGFRSEGSTILLGPHLMGTVAHSEARSVRIDFIPGSRLQRQQLQQLLLCVQYRAAAQQAREVAVDAETEGGAREGTTDWSRKELRVTIAEDSTPRTSQVTLPVRCR
eukprot:TRINITY_DN7834_c5_g1_i1.p1 TRINITY_DN7834_c5_g1~~TRINITY_DN7834_c5_g1_i1.p1  ORF type:complete len:2232 (+),score=652.91 TRINITY_DN7834_c5_g1_i1:984-6698(+)